MNLRLCHKGCNENKDKMTENEYIKLILHKPYSVITNNIETMAKLKNMRGCTITNRW